MKLPQYKDPKHRRANNVAYLAALLVPELAERIKAKCYPSLNVELMLALDERFYADAREFVDRQLTRLEELQ